MKNFKAADTYKLIRLLLFTRNLGLAEQFKWTILKLLFLIVKNKDVNATFNAPKLKSVTPSQ